MHTPLPEWVLWSEVGIRVGWTTIALAIWFVMSRRGHDGGTWAIVGLVLGPLAIPMAIVSARRASRRPLLVVEDGATVDAGVLVAVDASQPETWASVAWLVNTLATPAELAAVVDRDTLDIAARNASLQRARRALAAVADAVNGPQPRQVILEGRPVPAVAKRRLALGIATVVAPANRFGDQLRSALGAVCLQPDGVNQVPPRRTKRS